MATDADNDEGWGGGTSESTQHAASAPRRRAQMASSSAGLSLEDGERVREAPESRSTTANAPRRLEVGVRGGGRADGEGSRDTKRASAGSAGAAGTSCL